MVWDAQRFYLFAEGKTASPEVSQVLMEMPVSCTIWVSIIALYSTHCSADLFPVKVIASFT